MEQTIRIQRELENLLQQLENLRNINQLMSDNAEGSKTLIKHVDSYIKAIEELKKGIEQELKVIGSELGRVVDQANVAIKSTNDQSAVLQSDIRSQFENIRADLNGSFRQLGVDINYQGEALDAKLARREYSISENLVQIRSDIEVAMNQKIDASFERQNEEIRSLKAVTAEVRRDINELKSLLWIVLSVSILCAIAIVVILK